MGLLVSRVFFATVSRFFFLREFCGLSPQFGAETECPAFGFNQFPPISGSAQAKKKNALLREMDQGERVNEVKCEGFGRGVREKACSLNPPTEKKDVNYHQCS